MGKSGARAKGNHGGTESPGSSFSRIRQLLSGSNDADPAPLWTPTDTNLLDAQNGPMANLGVSTVDVYTGVRRERRQHVGARRPISRRSSSRTAWSGCRSRAWGGFSQFVRPAHGRGRARSRRRARTTAWSTAGRRSTQLPTIAELPQTMSGQAQLQPDYVAANIKAIAVQRGRDLAVCRCRSDRVRRRRDRRHDRRDFRQRQSVSRRRLGCESYGTGDLNPTNPVDVIEDGPAGSTDEGRAMLENIHDVAPGASLAFDTAGTIGDLTMSQSITALADQPANRTSIVDDVALRRRSDVPGRHDLVRRSTPSSRLRA